jgi:hypothetical protein
MENYHVDEEGLDRYSMNQAASAELDAIEDHLLVCEACRVRLAQNDEKIKAIRWAFLLEERKGAEESQTLATTPGNEI